MKTRIKILKITTLFQTNIWSTTIKKSTQMKKFKKLKPLKDTGKLMTSTQSTDNIGTPTKKPNSSKQETTKQKFTAKTKLTNYL